ncbi:sensor histidine kinase [Candidatus Gracilibacteria bacterium]|nr:sensor histidine kinase [Candidatus Gracilibacteria bacterium]
MSLQTRPSHENQLDPDAFEDYVTKEVITCASGASFDTAPLAARPINREELFSELHSLAQFTLLHELNPDLEKLISTPTLLKALVAIEQLIARLPSPHEDNLDTNFLSKLSTLCDEIATLTEGIHSVAKIKDDEGNLRNPQFDLAHRFLDHDLNAFLMKPAQYAKAMIEDDSDEYMPRLRSMMPFMRDLVQAIAHTMLAVVSKQPKKEQFNLVDAFRPICSAIQYQHKGKYSDLEIDVEVDEDCMLVGDKNIISYAVYIALDNAIKAFYNKNGRERRPNLRIAGSTMHGVMTLKVTDDGPGVDRPKLIKKILGYIEKREKKGETLTHFEVAFKTDPDAVLREVGYDAIMDYLNAHGITMTEGGTGIGLEIATSAMSSLAGVVRVYDNSVDQQSIAGATTEYNFPAIITDSPTHGIRAVVSHVARHVLADISPRALPTIIKAEYLRELRYNPPAQKEAPDESEIVVLDDEKEMPSVSGIIE